MVGLLFLLLSLARARQILQLALCDHQRLRSACTYTQYGKVFVYPSLDSLEAVEGPCDQLRLWSNARTRRLIWVFAGRTCLIVGFVVRLFIFLCLWILQDIFYTTFHFKINSRFLLVHIYGFWFRRRGQKCVLPSATSVSLLTLILCIWILDLIVVYLGLWSSCKFNPVQSKDILTTSLYQSNPWTGIWTGN